MTTGNADHKKCLNCGADLSGGFCARCGQKDIDLNVSIGHIISDFLGDFFSYDSRVFRTLVPLLFKPGFLTLQYIHGRRVHYVPPVRLFIIISLLYFFSLTLIGFEGKNIVINYEPDEDKIIVPATVSEGGVAVGSETTEKQLPAVSDTNHDDKNKLEDLVVGKIVSAGQNQQLVKDKITEWMPRVMFFLIPVFAFILKICYMKSDRFYIHHLIFSLHFHSFSFLLLFLLLPLAAISDDLTVLISMIAMATYLFFGMRRVYAESAGRTMIKIMFLSASYLGVFTATMLSLLIVVIMLQA